MVLYNSALNRAENGARDRLDIEMSNGAVGTGSVTQTSTQLGNEVFRDAFDNSNKSQGQLNRQLIIGATEANGNQLSEAGAFTDSTGGDLLQAGNFTSTAKVNDIEILVDFQIEFNAKTV